MVNVYLNTQSAVHLKCSVYYFFRLAHILNTRSLSEMSDQVILKVVGQVSFSDIRSFLEYVHRFVASGPGVDIECRISYPESPSQGGYLTRPNSRGGPGVFVRCLVPPDVANNFRAYLEAEHWKVRPQCHLCGEGMMAEDANWSCTDCGTRFQFEKMA